VERDHDGPTRLPPRSYPEFSRKVTRNYSDPIVATAGVGIAHGVATLERIGATLRIL
jgi:hypothetical protein